MDLIYTETLMAQSNKKILLVEDEEIIAYIQKKQLTQFGYDVMHVFSGESAVDLIQLKKEKFDLVLMDIDLGNGIDGTVAAELILKDTDIPLLFLSSHTEPEIVEKTERITSYGYVVKNSGITILDASIKMAFKLFEAKLKEKQKEDALQISEEKFYKIFQLSPIAISITKIANSEIVDVNKRFEILFDLKKEDVIGKTTFALNLWEDPSVREKYIPRYMNDRILNNIELNFKDRHGKVIPAIVNFFMIEIDNIDYSVSLVETKNEL
jgi:PAS domain S-box-containing protein